MRRFLKILWFATKLGFVVFSLALIAVCSFLVYLVFHEVSLPVSPVHRAIGRVAPTNLTVRVKSMEFGFRRGLSLHGVSVRDRSGGGAGVFVAGADSLCVNPFSWRVRVVGARYPRLPDSYYAPENHERNERVEAVLPRLPKLSLELVRPDILGVRPERVIADVDVSPDGVLVDRVRLDWPDKDEEMHINGFCRIDLARQEIVGDVEGRAKQAHIRPMIEVLDVPVALPYIDGFTEVPSPVPSGCSWKVNLINNDLDLDLDLRPKLGRYNGVRMDHARGKLHLHVYTRGDWLNYSHTFGPIVGAGPKGEPLEGTVKVSGTNGYNTVDVDAKSALPVADLLRIGGFVEDYVGEDVVGDSKCRLQFRFPRSMTNNYEVLNGFGHVEVKNGKVMRMKGFRGLLDQLADKVPGVSWFTDSTQASCDYVITNGVIKTDNVYIEGSVFSIKMYGKFDTTKDALDFVARVQFTKSDSVAGKILHPLAWPFTKLLLEFRLNGTSAEPKWHYINVIDRVVEATK